MHHTAVRALFARPPVEVPREMNGPWEWRYFFAATATLPKSMLFVRFAPDGKVESKGAVTVQEAP